MTQRVEHRHSGKNDWQTPDSVFKPLDEEFGFTLDVCASEENYKVDPYIPEECDALIQSWAPRICWMNPPYNDWQRWVKKAYEESLKGATVVCLLPARTDTKAFHEYILPFAEIRFIKGRIRFVGADSGAPFPSLIAIFYPLGQLMLRDWPITSFTIDKSE